MKKWRSGKLGDFITLQRGFDLPSQERQRGRVPIVSSSGIKDYHAIAKVPAPGVVTGRYGTIGQVFYITEDFWPLNTTLYVKDFKGNDPRFVSYLLRTLDFQAHNDKSSVPGLNRNHLHQIETIFPSLSEQQDIVALLGTLDDKVELNQRMNATLEAMARAIFKSWFVDFDPVRAKMDGRQPAGMDTDTAALFPAHFQDSSLGPIPKGWEIDTIKNRASNIQYGFTQSAMDQPIGPQFLRITDIRGGKIDWGSVPFCEAAEEDLEKYRVVDGDIFVARTGASTGDNVYVIDPPTAVFASYLVRFQFKSRGIGRLVGEFMQTSDYANYVAGTIGGSAQPNANAQTLADASMIFPTERVADAFYHILRPLDLKRAANLDQSRTLVALRDTLLPKLLSGEVSAKGLN